MEFDNVSFSVSAPGKLILMGEHSVLYGKRGIAVAISKRTFLHFKEHKQANGQITFNLKNMNCTSEWDFKSVYDLITSNKSLIKDNMGEFSLLTPELLNHDEFVESLKTFVTKKGFEKGPNQKSVIGLFYVIIGMLWCTDVNITPFDIEILSDLTIGAGIGSSASFAVCCAAAVYHYIRLKGVQKHGTGEFNISYEMFKPCKMMLSQHYKAFNDKDKEVINKWAYCVEKVMHGTPSGLDNTICTYGNAVLINMTENRSNGQKFQMLDDVPPLRVLLVDSGVKRSTSNLVEKVSQLRKLLPDPIDAVLNSMDKVALEFIKLLTEIKEKEGCGEATSVYTKLETLVNIQHCLLKSLGVSHKRLEEIVDICLKEDIFAAKLTGAGGGGFAFALISPTISENVVDKIVSSLSAADFAVEDITVNAEGVKLDFKTL